MNKFEKARFHVDLVEAASKAVVDAVWDKIRFDSDYSDYFDYAEDEAPKWYDEEWLEAHVNDAGREYLKMAEDFAKQLDKLL